MAARQALVAMRAELGQQRMANEQRWAGLQAAQDCLVNLKVQPPRLWLCRLGSGIVQRSKSGWSSQWAELSWVLGHMGLSGRVRPWQAQLCMRSLAVGITGSTYTQPDGCAAEGCTRHCHVE